MEKLTDKERKQIIAARAEGRSARELAERFGVSVSTVRRVWKNEPEAARIIAEKKEENTKAILDYMDGKKDLVCEIIDKGLSVLNSQDKLAEANPAQITRAIETLIDRFASGEQEKEPSYEDKAFTLPAELIGSAYADINRDISAHNHTESMFKGGRGSLKSSFISLKIIELMMNNPGMNAVILRKVGKTLEKSVYNQILWAIGVLGLAEQFSVRKSALEISLKATGQTLYFAGLDDPMKLKSIKPRVGSVGILWFEELDQFAGPEECRSVRQSVIRGSDTAYVFQSFNPPKSRNNWANLEAEIPKERRIVLHTDYRSVPAQWLGREFLEEAAYQKEVNFTAYEHEYLGIPNGNGGLVFENVAAEPISDEQISRFDRRLYGVDWGYYPDPWAFNGVYYDAARRVLYVFQELTALKKGNRETAELLRAAGVTGEALITADSAEPKSVADYRSFGFNCVGARKGPGSLDYSMKWLQSLARIVIDPNRCPKTHREFIQYEYQRTKDGEIVSGYPDRDNHHIDAVRYATEEIWKWMGN